MDKVDLNASIMEQRNGNKYGKSRFDPALSNLLFKTQKDIDSDIKVVIQEFVNKRNRQPTQEEVVAAYVLLEEKRKKDKITDVEMQEYLNENEEELDVEKDFQQDKEQNQDLNIQAMKELEDEEQELFLLDRLGNNRARLQVREEIEERNLQDRQKQMMERSLKILAALEKIKEAIKQEKGTLEISGDILKGLNPKEMKQQIGLLKAMGVQEVLKEQDGNIFESEGRDITDFSEIGDVGLEISFDALRNVDLSQLKQWFNDKDITLDEEEPIKIAGLDDKIKSEPENKIIEDDEMSL